MKRVCMLVALAVSSITSSGCSFIFGFPDYEPETPLTVAEWAAVNEIEARVPLAVQKFGRPAFKVRPQITVVRSPDQHIPRFNKLWKDLHWGGVEPRVPGEGYSGLWVVPDLYVSRIGARNTDKIFRELYAHERSHSFFEGGSGHGGVQVEIERFLLGE